MLVKCMESTHVCIDSLQSTCAGPRCRCAEILFAFNTCKLRPSHHQQSAHRPSTISFTSFFRSWPSISLCFQLSSFIIEAHFTFIITSRPAQVRSSSNSFISTDNLSTPAIGSTRPTNILPLVAFVRLYSARNHFCKYLVLQ